MRRGLGKLFAMSRDVEVEWMCLGWTCSCSMFESFLLLTQLSKGTDDKLLKTARNMPPKKSNEILGFIKSIKLQALNGG